MHYTHNDAAFNKAAKAATSVDALGGVMLLHTAYGIDQICREVAEDAEDEGFKGDLSRLRQGPSLKELIASSRQQPPTPQEVAEAKERTERNMPLLEKSMAALNAPNLQMAQQVEILGNMRSMLFATVVYMDRLGNLPEAYEALVSPPARNNISAPAPKM